MTEPLVPAEVTLRGLPWMRLDTERLLNSDLFALATGDEFKAAVALWCKSWSQLPAGSLPNDDRILAALSGAGPRWRRVKTMAMRGWEEADDGRLYHPVVAEQVMAAWQERVEFRAAIDGQNERKRKERAERAHMFAELKANGIELAWNTSTAKLRDALGELSQPDTAQSQEPVTPVTVTVTAKTGRDGTLRAFTSDTTARTDVSEGSAEDLARALQGVGFPDCASTLPDLVAAKREGVTGEELAAVAISHAGKSLAYVVATARGKRQDAVDRAAKRGDSPAPPPVNPEAVAKAAALHELDRRVIDATRSWELGVITEAVRDARIAGARQDYAAVVGQEALQA